MYMNPLTIPRNTKTLISNNKNHTHKTYTKTTQNSYSNQSQNYKIYWDFPNLSNKLYSTPWEKEPVPRTKHVRFRVSPRMTYHKRHQVREYLVCMRETVAQSISSFNSKLNSTINLIISLITTVINKILLKNGQQS